MLKRTLETTVTLQPSCGGLDWGSGVRRPNGPVDTRSPITMWRLLIWAYQTEWVRFAGTGAADWSGHAATDGTSTAALCRYLERGDAGGGGGVSMGRPSAHDDAEWIAGCVSYLDRDERWLLINAAEAGQVPDWDRSFDAGHMVPVLRANGKPRMILDARSRRPSACLIKHEGFTVAEIAEIRGAMQENYSRFVRLLWILRDVLVADDQLTRWQVTGVGVRECPWQLKAA